MSHSQQGAQRKSVLGIGTKRSGLTISHCWNLLGRAEVEEAPGEGHEKLVEDNKLEGKRKGTFLPPLLDGRARHSSWFEALKLLHPLDYK